MTRRRSIAVILTVIALFAASMALRSPVPLTAQATPPNQNRVNPGVPHREPVPPAVLALNGPGEPTLVSATNPVPVEVQAPVAVTTRTPLAVNDGGQAITATGNYLFVFPNEVTLPGLGGKVESVEVAVTQISGKWVTASYAGSTTGGTRTQATLVFNTEQLLAILARR